MIQILITAALVLCFLKLVDKENVIDYFGAFTIYLVPLAIVWLAGIAINSFALPSFLHFVVYSVFFIAPFLIISAIYDQYSLKKKALLSFGVFAIVTVTQIGLLVITTANETPIA